MSVLIRLFTKLLMLVFVTSACASISAPEPTATSEPLDKILFVGNSFTGWNLGLDWNMELLAGSINPPLVIEADMVTKMGASLEEIWEHTNAREKIDKGDYDVVVLQGAIPETESWNISKSAETFHEYVRKFDAEIKEAGAETVLFMQWPYEQYGLKPITIEEIDQAYRDIALELGVDVAPVGLAWQRVMEERPELDMYDDDGVHPSIHGTYLAVNVVYATVFGKSPIGIAYLPSAGSWSEGGGLTDEETAYLQRIAWETVQEYQAQQ